MFLKINKHYYFNYKQKVIKFLAAIIIIHRYKIKIQNKNLIK